MLYASSLECCLAAANPGLQLLTNAFSHRFLQDQSLLYLLLTTNSSPHLSASLVKLAEQVKRKRYKLSGEEIKIFVDDSQDDAEAGRTDGKSTKKAGGCE
jgi:hypothetical protein